MQGHELAAQSIDRTNRLVVDGASARGRRRRCEFGLACGAHDNGRRHFDLGQGVAGIGWAAEGFCAEHCDHVAGHARAEQGRSTGQDVLARRGRRGNQCRGTGFLDRGRKQRRPGFG